MADKKYLLAWFSDDSVDRGLRFITKENLGSPHANCGKWFTREEVREYPKYEDLFIIRIPDHTVECGSFT